MTIKPNADEIKPPITETQKGDEAIDNKQTSITTTEKPIIDLQPVDLSKPLPELNDAEIVPIDLMADYWTPEKIGESKRVFFDTVKIRKVLDQQNQDVVIELPCVYFVEKNGDSVKTISNGSKRLVGIFETGQFERGIPLLITYLGKKKNATNSFQSDQWSVKPLLIKL